MNSATSATSATSAKDLILKPISSADASRMVDAIHYSGKHVTNSQVHFGVFLNGRCGGALQFGPSMDKSKLVGLVKGTLWNEFIELNRLALADWLPRNSESRAISVAMRLLRQHYPHLKWVVSFADGMQCGDGTIYRASGFLLTGISSGSMVELPPDLARLNGGPVAHRLKMQDKCSLLSQEIMRRTGGRNLTNVEYVRRFGGRILPGYMFRYIYFLKPECRELLTVPVIPFEKIKEIGGSMYLGQKPDTARGDSIDSNAPSIQPGEGGANPTSPLQTANPTDA